mgnify:CR=1 FL=1
MSLINIKSPIDYQSIKNGAVEFEIGCERTVPLKSNFSIWVEYSKTPDFKNLTLLEVSEVKKNVNGAWSPIQNNLTGIPGQIKFKVNSPSTEGALYTRVVFATPDERVCSKFITLSKCNKLDFCLQNPIVTEYSTSKVKVTLDYDVINPENLEIQVFVCNNALDGVNVTWEEMTDEFKAGKFYTIQNGRINEGYATNVRVVVTKKNFDSSIRIKKINIAHY